MTAQHEDHRATGRRIGAPDVAGRTPSVKRRFSPSFIALVAGALIILGAGALELNLATLSATGTAASRAAAALLEVETLVSALKDAEAGARGYALTGEEPYLVPYQRAAAQVAPEISAARGDLGGNPEYRKHLDAIGALAQRKLAAFRKLIEARRDSGLEAAVAVLRLGEGRRAMDAIRAEASALQQSIISDRDRALRNERWRAIASGSLVLGTSALAAILLGMVALWRRRIIEQRDRSIAALLEERAGSEFERLSAGVLLDSLPAGIVLADRTGRILRRNEAATRIWGGAAAQAAGRPDQETPQAWWPETGEALKPEDWAMARALADGKSRTGQVIRIRRRDGAIRTILNSAAPVRDAAGRVIGAVAAVQDITELRETQERLQEAEARYRAIVDSAPDAIVTTDEDGRIQSFNAAAERMFGYAAAEVSGRSIGTLMPEEAARAHDGHMDRYRRTGDRRIIGLGKEVTARRKDGHEFPIELSVTEWDAAGQRHFTGLIHDITERKRAQNELRESAQRFQRVFSDSPLGKAIVGTDLRVREANPALCRMLGYSVAELAGHLLCEMAVPEDREIGIAEVREVLESGMPSARFEKRYLTKSGGTIWVAVHVGAVLGADGTPHYALAIFEDITEHRQAEAALRRSEQRVRELQAEFLHVSRLSELGQMASTLAHELNQPLTASANYLSAARRLLAGAGGPGQTPRVLEALKLAGRESVRAGEIIRRMRSFVARGEADKRVEDLRGLIEEANRLVLSSVRQKEVQVHLDLEDSTAPVLADRVQIQQVILNLIRNATEAMDGCKRRELTISTRQLAPDQAEVRVADTGPGVSREVAEELFQPFVSTKRTGMGLGLSICRTIVEAHGGRIRAEPNPEGGTVFSFTLPTVAGLEQAEVA